MMIAGVLLIVLSFLCAGAALVCQRKDHVPDYGSTMGGEMTAGGLWSLASLLAGFGTGTLFRWYWGIPAFIGVYVLGWAIRCLVESMVTD